MYSYMMTINVTTRHIFTFLRQALPVLQTSSTINCFVSHPPN